MIEKGIREQHLKKVGRWSPWMKLKVYLPKHRSRKQPDESGDQQEIQANEPLGAGSQRGSSSKEREIPRTGYFQLEDNPYMIYHIFHSS